MTGVIHEVETDPDGRVLITIEEEVEFFLPARCASCLGEPTQWKQIFGETVAFPYCDACGPSHEGWQRRGVFLTLGLAAIIAVLVLRLWALAILIVLLLGQMFRSRWRPSVELMLSEPRTARFAFRNAEYARIFVEANGEGSEGADRGRRGCVKREGRRGAGGAPIGD